MGPLVRVGNRWCSCVDKGSYVVMYAMYSIVSGSGLRCTVCCLCVCVCA